MSLKDTTPRSRPQHPTPSKTPSITSTKSIYLTLYNFGSAILWANILIRTVLITGREGWGATEGKRWSFRDWGFGKVGGGKGGGFGRVGGGEVGVLYGEIGEVVKWTQTLALVEVLHSLFGIVRAPLLTTAMQVASRILLVWFIVSPFPHLTTTSPAYTTMLLAWSFTEVIRYSYFVFILNTSVPSLLQWLRYNGFFILYPLGIGSECWLIWRSVEGAEREWGRWAGWVLWGVLAAYVPGAWVLYGHMMGQRRRVMRGKGKAK
ncbi:PTPLA-domain-containing protein [Tothia fuscella]|uniref:Very-long-chain (3R)-3-hydroxyacyl-CoA dehydratase n=1 Tax=Tothia fuscella TaxID=1048955 RepID=A0A9P4NH78_9PEZI|nr:PTPLA-domain-containing protein [Tothia fuscella]